MQIKNYRPEDGFIHKGWQLRGSHLSEHSSIHVWVLLTTEETYTWIADSYGNDLLIHPNGYTMWLLADSLTPNEQRYGVAVANLIDAMIELSAQ